MPVCTFYGLQIVKLKVNLLFPLLLLLPILVAGFPAPQGYSEEKEYPDIEPKYEDNDFAKKIEFQCGQ